MRGLGHNLLCRVNTSYEALAQVTLGLGTVSAISEALV